MVGGGEDNNAKVGEITAVTPSHIITEIEQ